MRQRLETRCVARDKDSHGLPYVKVLRPGEGKKGAPIGRFVREVLDYLQQNKSTLWRSLFFHSCLAIYLRSETERHNNKKQTTTKCLFHLGSTARRRAERDMLGRGRRLYTSYVQLTRTSPSSIREGGCVIRETTPKESRQVPGRRCFCCNKNIKKGARGDLIIFERIINKRELWSTALDSEAATPAWSGRGI